VPASYVLLEAERIGAETNWTEGKVEAEWAADRSQPSRFLHGYVKGDGLDPLSLSRHEAPKRFFVGFISANWHGLQSISGVPDDEIQRDEDAPHEAELARRLAMTPAHWVPALGLDEGCRAQMGLPALALPPSRFFADEVAKGGVTIRTRRDCPAHAGHAGHESFPYPGPYPDSHVPQMLLYAAPGYTTSRSIGRHLKDGPLLDVRMLRNVRILRKRGKKWTKNPDVDLRELQRAAAGGDHDATLRLAQSLLRAGQLEDPADRNAVLAMFLEGGGLLSDGGLMARGWQLLYGPGGFVLQRPTYPEAAGWVLTVSNDPVRLGYDGKAVGWRDTPLVHFRMTHPALRGGGGVLHPDVIARGMGTPEALAEAAQFLESPRARFGGAMTLAADEGMIPRLTVPDWHEVEEAAGLPGLQDRILQSAGLKWHNSMPATEAGHIRSQAQDAIVFFETVTRGQYDRTLYPVNGFSDFEHVPFPDLLHELGFQDASWGNDAGARATLVVAGDDRQAGAWASDPQLGRRRKITWDDWPELESTQDEYEVSVFSHGLHPLDQEFGDGVRYVVHVNSHEDSGNYSEVGEARDEIGLALIMQDLGLRP
jgi:hypothetical protein